MRTAFFVLIGTLLILFVRELYLYLTIKKEPKPKYTDLSKMSFDKNLNYPENGSAFNIENWNTMDVTNFDITSGLNEKKFTIDLKKWDTKNVTAMVTIKNTAYLNYCKENQLEMHKFDFGIGLITFAKESEHPKLFDGSLD